MKDINLSPSTRLSDVNTKKREIVPFRFTLIRFAGDAANLLI